MKFKLSVLATSALIALSVHAGEGSGVRGGGHVVDVDSNPKLLDLVTTAVCDWKEGDEIFKENPGLKVLLKNLEKLDWYFASDLEKEIRFLKYCMTGSLVPVATDARYGGIVKPANEKTGQAGFRYNSSVYLDSSIYAKMDDHQRSMLITHEVVHSYLDMWTGQRALKLRSMVKFLARVKSGETLTRRMLHTEMDGNEIEFPLTVGNMERHKGAVLFLLGDLDQKVKLIKAAKKPETLIEFDSFQMRNLAPWDQVASLTGHGFEDAMIMAMKSSDLNELKVMLDEKEYKNINPAKFAVSEYMSFSDEQKGVIASSRVFEQLVTGGLDSLIKPQVFKGEFLIMAGKSLRALGQNYQGGQALEPLLHMEASDKFPSALKWLPEMMIVLNERGLLDHITGNTKFYDALGMKVQKREVLSLETRIAREKKTAIALLDNVSASIVEELGEEIGRRTDETTYNQIMKKIDFNKFKMEN